MPLSIILQKKSFDKQSANNAITTTISTLELCRHNCETNFQDIFLNAKKKKMEDLDIIILKPRTVKKQTNRVNHLTDSVEDYFRVAIYNPFLDFIINDIKARFTEETLSLYSLGIFMPQVSISQSLENFEAQLHIIWKQFGIVEEISKRIVNEEDFIIKLKGELQWWRQQWKDKKSKIPNSALDTLIKCDKEIFPVINILLTIMTTLPVSVASAERSFSSLRRIKTWMRCRMSEDRLSDLAVIHAHKEENIDIDTVINRLAMKKNRKLDFIL